MFGQVYLQHRWHLLVHIQDYLFVAAEVIFAISDLTIYFHKTHHQQFLNRLEHFLVVVELFVREIPFLILKVNHV